MTFETYFDKSYTLRKLTTEAYIRDPRFEALCFCGYFPKSGRSFKAVGYDQIAEELGKIDWSNTHFFSHHAQFDGLILSHHFNVYPALMGCTLSMARTQSRERLGDRLSLEALAEAIGGYEKTVDYAMFVGRRLRQLTPFQTEELAEQCLNDSMICYDIFHYFMSECGFPKEELTVIDATIKMFTSPVLIGDIDHFNKIAEEEVKRKEALLREIQVDNKHILLSNESFSKLLTDEGIEIAYKQGKNGLIPAFAKSDNFMQELLESPDERIATIAEARINARSSIVETRAHRFAQISSRGAIPIYLRYSSAHTLRWGGGDKQNSQNFNRKGGLREGITAPYGCSLIVADYAQIEARILLCVAKQFDQLAYFEQGKDAYVAMAASLYGIPPHEVTRQQRGMGKQLVLACGYGAGEYTIQRTAKSGQYTDGIPLIISIEEALLAKQVYRNSNPRVRYLWYWAEDVLRYMLSEDKQVTPFPDDYALPIHVKDRKVYLPNGLSLDFSSLEYVPLGEGDTIRNDHQKIYTADGWKDYKELRVKHKHEITKIYGAKFVENIIQALARVVMSQAIVNLRNEPLLASVRPVMTAHDELVFVCKDEELDIAVPTINAIMIKRPKWLSKVPLKVETTVAKRYGK